MRSATLQREYNAEKILKRSERLHTQFYPVPHQKELVKTNLSGAPRHFHLTPRTEGFLTKSELIKSYNDCGQYLHRGSIRRLVTKWYPDIDFERIKTWNERVGSLLGPYHYIGLCGNDKFILCVMNNTDDNNVVQCALAESVGASPTGFIT